MPAGGGAAEVNDLEVLAIAKALEGPTADADELWERAHRKAADDGDVSRAVRCAFWLSFLLLNRGEVPRGSGWVDRGQRMLDESQLECVERGYVRYAAALRAVLSGDPESAHLGFRDAAAIGIEYRSTELTTLAWVGIGRCQIYSGDIAGGVALLDEAMVSVMARDVSPIAVGDIYCTVIDACHELFDVRRVTDWTAVLSDWCDAHPSLTLYRGQCLLHRAEVLQLRGHWDDALDEARRVSDLHEAPPAVVGSARARIGDLECLRGRFAESEAAYREASELGVDPNPGLPLLRLAEGQIEIADASIRRALEQADDPISRARTLGPAVEILLSAAEVDGARAVADELRETADSLDAPYLAALAAQALGRVAFAAGDPRIALTELRRAADAWRDLEVPYEAARTRTLLAQVYRVVGDHEGARWELESARAAFERLGAPLDVESAERLLGAQPVADRGLSPREMEVLTLVAQGATNRAIASELFISERTVESHVRRIFQKLGVTTRAAATAAAYERGLRSISGTTD